MNPDGIEKVPEDRISVLEREVRDYRKALLELSSRVVNLEERVSRIEKTST